jgi:hypothetical protein
MLPARFLGPSYRSMFLARLGRDTLRRAQRKEGTGYLVEYEQGTICDASA